MNKFTKWFNEKLTVCRYPLPGEIAKMPEGSHVINVSDEYISYNHIAAMRKGVFHHWFPLSEGTGDMGINSIFGAIQILHMAEKSDAKVLLHCHAGVNRSPVVKEAYYFLRTGEHLRVANSKLVKDLDAWQELPETALAPSMLLNNIEHGFLPEKGKLEKFLKLIGTMTEEMEETNRGGMLTKAKIDSRIN